ncbi:GAF domain-containing protein [Myxosarcina sp. GI1]|uniref:GAF domain-containing protein n=1 Tax=Myxosarcina sp. GI1 TaxID=1541065 RepID=UPI0006907C48|nr:GAF domain-containing protein [Myxosarcina sp. GI1]
MNIKPLLTDSDRGKIQQSDLLAEFIQDRESELVLDLVKEIRAAVSEQDFYSVSVRTVYRVLKCDRVVVYSLEKDSHEKIIAEAVNPRFTRTLGTVIEDPCFENRYINKYQQGRITTITNIYEAGMSRCYVENLEKIEVKANLVVPICDAEGLLYGLLIAHQCSDFRQWKQSEIDFALQIASWTAERLLEWKKQQQLSSKLEKAARWQEQMTELVRKLHQQEKVASVLQFAVEKAKETLECDRVVIYGLQEENIGKIVAEAKISPLAPILNSVIKDPCFEYRYIDKYKHGRVSAISNIFEAGMSKCYVENLDKIAVKSTLVVPVNWDDGEVYGLLVAHQCFKFREWQTEEIEWLKQVGFHTGLSLSKVKLNERIDDNQSNIASIELARDTITISKSNIEQIREPVRDASQLLIEANNLNKLLIREFNSIIESISPQSRKQTKFIQILLKKLSANLIELKKAHIALHKNSNSINELLETAARDLYAKESKKL